MILQSAINTRSAEFRARAAHNNALLETLAARTAVAALGGNERARARHIARGKLLPRQRVERLLDVG